MYNRIVILIGKLYFKLYFMYVHRGNVGIEFYEIMVLISQILQCFHNMIDLIKPTHSSVCFKTIVISF